MKNQLLFMLMALGLGASIAWTLKPSPDIPYQPLFDATAEIRYIYVPDSTDAPLSAVIRNVRADEDINPTMTYNQLTPWDFEVKHEDFEITGVCYGIKVTGLEIESVEFKGEAEIRVYPDRVETTPRTPGLTLNVTAYKAKKKQRGRLFQLDFIAGAQAVPPYKPLVGIGVGFRRIPFTRIRVPFTLGGAWIGDAPGIFLVWRW